MPSHVRIFWWLSITIVVYWFFSTAWFLTFPTDHYRAILAKLPADFREATHRADILIGIVSTTIWGGLTLGSAWLAAFRRLNWARWAFAIVFLIRQATPLMVYAYYHQLSYYVAKLSHENWGDPFDYVAPTLTIAAVMFVFLGNARPWFRKSGISSAT